MDPLTTPARSGLCATCDRTRPLSFHHLVPRTLHGGRWCRKRFTRDDKRRGVEVCHDCHDAFHRLAGARELAECCDNVQALRAHARIGPVIEALREPSAVG